VYKLACSLCLLSMAGAVLLIGGCSRSQSSPTMGARFERIGKVEGPKTVRQVEDIMGEPGRNAEELVVPDEKDVSPKLKDRLRGIVTGKPGVTVLVWREKVGDGVWIVTVDFKDGKTTGGGGQWRAEPDEWPAADK
jgi:hypothetical protein